MGDHLRVELIGVRMRLAGLVARGHFARLSDLLNARQSLDLVEAVFVAGPEQETPVVFPELHVRLDDISIVGQRDDAPAGDHRERVPMRRRHLVLMTGAHMVYGWAHLHPDASLPVYLERTDQPFMPLSDVRVRWLPERRLAARYPFALVRRSHVIGVATAVQPPMPQLELPGVVEVPATLD